MSANSTVPSPEGAAAAVDGSPLVIVADSAAEAGRAVADRIAGVIAERPDAVVGVATGSSPGPVYRALVEHRAAGLDVSRVTWVALDEYIGLPAGHPESYREVLRRDLVEPLGLDPDRVMVPSADGMRPEDAAARYERRIADLGGVDIQLLGIGSNGHIGFNEPGTPFDSRTRVAHLAERTREDNARFFPSADDVPLECITQGLATIMSARRLVLIASGSYKAAAVAAALGGPVTPECPASIVQRHPDVVVALDPAAAERLPERLAR